MRNLRLLTGLLAVLIAPAAGAISLAGIELATLANSVVAAGPVATGTGSGPGKLAFNDQDSPDYNTYIDFTKLTTNLTDADAATSAFSLYSDAYVDMAFTGANSIYNGAGADLALFFAGTSNSVSIVLNGITNSYLAQTPPVPTTVTDRYGIYNLTVALIDLDDFGFGTTDPLGTFRILLGNSTRPELSLVGGFHTSATVSNVPLPLPALLFASGLGVLGLFSRKRKHS